MAERRQPKRADRYFFTTIIVDDPAIAYAAEILRRDPSAAVDLRLSDRATIYTASMRDALINDARTMFGERVSMRIEYDLRIALPEMVVPIIASPARRRRRDRRAA